MGRRYADYTVEVDTVDSKTSVHYGSARNGKLARFTYRLFRIPSQRLFVVRYFHDATEQDREFLNATLHVQAALWRQNEECAKKYRRSDGTYGFRMAAGRFVDDPLVQLELEMMIDLSSELRDLTREDAK